MTATKPNQPQRRLPLYRRAWFLTSATIIIIAVIVGLIISITKPNSEQPSQDSPESSAPVTQESPTAQTDNNSNDDSDAPEVNPDQVVVQYEGENPNNASELSGSVSYTDYSGGVLAVGTMIDQYLSSGTCELRATSSNGQVYTATSDIIPAVSTSACRELTVSIAPGTYTIEITLKGNNKQGLINKEITL